MPHMPAWLIAVISSMTTLMVAGLGFYQWRRSERRQLDQLEIIESERTLKQEQFLRSSSDPLRVKRAAALEEVLQRLTELEAVVRLTHEPNQDLSRKLHEAYSTLIMKRSLLTATEIGHAQSYIANLYSVNEVMGKAHFSTARFGEQYPQTNENSPELTEAAPHFNGIRIAHLSLAQSLRIALGEDQTVFDSKWV